MHHKSYSSRHRAPFVHLIFVWRYLCRPSLFCRLDHSFEYILQMLSTEYPDDEDREEGSKERGEKRREREGRREWLEKWTRRIEEIEREGDRLKGVSRYCWGNTKEEIKRESYKCPGKFTWSTDVPCHQISLFS